MLKCLYESCVVNLAFDRKIYIVYYRNIVNINNKTYKN